MAENDPDWHNDPLWYDRTEMEAPVGAVLEASAYLMCAVLAGVALAMRLYWLPDDLWRSISHRIARHRASRLGRR